MYTRHHKTFLFFFSSQLFCFSKIARTEKYEMFQKKMKCREKKTQQRTTLIIRKKREGEEKEKLRN